MQATFLWSCCSISQKQLCHQERCSRFLDTPTLAHMMAMMKILNYFNCWSHNCFKSTGGITMLETQSQKKCKRRIWTSNAKPWTEDMSIKVVYLMSCAEPISPLCQHARLIAPLPANTSTKLFTFSLLAGANLSFWTRRTMSKMSTYILQVFQKEISHMVLICFPSKLLRRQKSSNWYLERIKYIQLTKKRGLVLLRLALCLICQSFMKTSRTEHMGGGYTSIWMVSKIQMIEFQASQAEINHTGPNKGPHSTNCSVSNCCRITYTGAPTSRLTSFFKSHDEVQKAINKGLSWVTMALLALL